MGLDMYLKVATYLHNFDNTPPLEKASYQKVLGEVGVGGFKPANSIPYVTVKILFADWKNAYQIHRWLVDNALNVGDVRQAESEIGRDQLQELLILCRQLLGSRDRKAAAKLLPLPKGLFRTKEERQAYWQVDYWLHLEHTIQQLSPVLDDPKFADWEFFYRAS
jgi:hypothetical protein